MRIQGINSSNYQNNPQNNNIRFKQNVYSVVELSHNQGLMGSNLGKLRRYFVHLAFQLNRINPEDCVRTITSATGNKVEFFLMDGTTKLCKETRMLDAEAVLEKARKSSDKGEISLLSTMDGNFNAFLREIGVKTN